MAKSAPVNDVLCSAVEYLVKLGTNLRRRSETLKDKRIKKDKLRNTLAVQKAANKVLLLCELSKKSIVTVESSVNTILSQIKTLQGSAYSGKSYSSESISNYEYFQHNCWRLKIRQKIHLKHYTSAKVVATAMPSSLASKYPVFYDCKLLRLRKRAERNEENTKTTNSETFKSVKFNDSVVVCGENVESEIACNDSSKLSQILVADGGIKKPTKKNLSSSEDYSEGCQKKAIESEKKSSMKVNPYSNIENSLQNKQDLLQTNSEKNSTDNFIQTSTNEHEKESLINKTNQNEEENDDIKSNEVQFNDEREEDNFDSQLGSENIEITNNYENDRSDDSNSCKTTYIKCVNINRLLRPDKVPKDLPPVVIESDSDDNLSKSHKPKKKFKHEAKAKRNLKHKAHFHNKVKDVQNFKARKFCIQITRLPILTPQYLVSHNLKKIIQNGAVLCEISPMVITDIQSDHSGKSNDGKDNFKPDDDILPTKTSLLQLSDSELSDDDTRNVNETVKKQLLCDSDSDKENPKDTSPFNNKNDSSKDAIHINETIEQNVDMDKCNEDGLTKKSKSLDKESDYIVQQKERKLDSHRVLLTPDITNEETNEDCDLFDKLKDSVDNREHSDSNECIESPESKKIRLLDSISKRKLLSPSSSSDTVDEQLKQTYDKIREDLLEDSPEKDSINKSGSESSISNTSGNSDTKLRKRKLTKRRSNENCNSKMDSNGKTSSSSDDTNNEDKAINGLTDLRTLKRSRRQRTEKRNLLHEYRMAKMPNVPVIGEELLLEPESSSDVPSPAANEDCEELPSITVPGLNGDNDSLAKEDLLGDSDTSTSQPEHKNSQEDKGNSEEENLKSKRRKANAISSDSEAGSSRRKDHRMSDFEDSDDDGLEPVKRKRKKNKRLDEDSEGSGSSDGQKKRRRIKNIDDSDGSGSETENEGRNKHGRKNIRKVMGKNQLEEATKKAAREEKERIARITERQKLYNNLQFDESGKPDEVVLDKVVLDFDPDTKEPTIQVDKGLVRKLKPHQANGIKFMWDACFESVKRIKKGKGSGCILAHCMGLGKTLQVVSLTHTLLTHSDLTNVNRVLVVCPLSTVLNWVNEFKMWLKHSETDYEVDVYELSRFKQNSDRAFQLSQWYQHGGVCVLGYEMFRNLSSDSNKKFKKKMLKNFQESLVDPGPDLVVCDEGHLLKNEKTSLSQAMNKVKTLRRIVLTGTPLQNNLKEYYCMVQFVKPNLLGKYNEYLNRFVNPITNGQYTDSTEHDIKIMKRRSHVLHKMLDGAVQRRDYGVLAPFLPPKHEYVLFITLNEVQIKLYTHYLDNYSRRPLPGKSSGFLFPDFQSLQRIWTHPLVLKYNSERYEIMQQKKREREEEDSEGSLVDFINDDSTPDESSTEESSDDSSDMSDDSRKKSKKKKSPKKSKGRSTRRGTRANPVEAEEDDVQEVIEVKNENPTEWWMSLVNEEELDDMRNSHKLVLLFDILRQCEAIGDKLLVFSQSLYSLDLIEHFLGKVDEATQEGRVDEKLGGHVGSWSPGVDYFRLDGSTSCENRSIWCKNFNREDNPRARLFLISTRAGGLGINLVAANRVVIFDVSWNPSHDVQSIFRVYRFGQKKPCYVYRFLVMGTMEEKIYERQVTKQAISKRVIDEQQIDRHYAENDLAELYKFEPKPPQPRPIPPLPKDRLFAEMLKEHEQLIYKYHEHDSLLENKEEETLTEEERKAAWEDFENEKTRPPPAVFAQPYAMHNGMMLAQQQQLAYAALAATLRKEAPTITENQIRDMIPLLYGANPQLMQKLGEMYKYPQSGMMNPGMMNAVMNSGAGGGSMPLGGSSGLQYEPPWQRQQQMRLQQLMQQQNQMGAKFYAGGLGSRDPVAMALQHQRAREMMLGERTRGRPPNRDTAPRTNSHDVVNLDSD
ncbi:transcriptional regulator ATRX homolog isoform X2 [Pieris rapae]|uniref:transcriptional regulator ATRX homolog isoform X2 n=1 Tax=Pieris rapae TaxID=64459 RepID=UPI001E27AB92|nr:transcriptional regulator ATRX homolog isoform X2 [Pieris rapae]